MRDMLERDFFGKVVAHVYSIEHQQKGPPHAHCLFTLHPSVPTWDPAWVDQYVNAEIPVMPDDDDHSQEAEETRAYIEFLANSMFHDCHGKLLGIGHPDQSQPAL